MKSDAITNVTKIYQVCLESLRIWHIKASLLCFDKIRAQYFSYKDILERELKHVRNLISIHERSSKSYTWKLKAILMCGLKYIWIILLKRGFRQQRCIWTVYICNLHLRVLNTVFHWIFQYPCDKSSSLVRRKTYSS